ncbi:MAG TPA: heavy-metal-associated domain-containing protein [Desulfomonilaceae bacterium]|nr:heavy-metal-associated domain-containing protein [Desulfomonilaceae bacterium]
MSSERHVKKIDMETLDQADRKISLNKARRLGMALVLILCAAGGGYAAYRMITGDIVASRFTVNKMTCPACVITVKEVTSKVPGVVEADVSLAAQDVTVKFRDKQANPEQIKDAIARAGYPVKLDGLFSPSGSGIGETVVATVNGKPLFAKDLKVSLYADKLDGSEPDPASAFFTVVGKEILLQQADSKTIVVQPQEVEEEIEAVFKEKGMQPEEFVKRINEKFGSREKYFQVVGQRLGIRKLLEENVVQGTQDPQEKSRKTLEWIGTVFKDADVKIVESSFREKVHAAAGKDDWKTFWPRMIGGSTELKSVLVQ